MSGRINEDKTSTGKMGYPAATSLVNHDSGIETLFLVFSKNLRGTEQATK